MTKEDFIYVGIDLHKETHTAVMIDCYNNKLGEITFANRPADFPKLVSKVKKSNTDSKAVVYGLENAYGYGRPLAVWLIDKGYLVKDVNTAISHRQAKHRGAMYRKYVVNKIREGISKLSQYNSFDVEEIQKACNKIVDSNYVNEWFWNKPVKSKQVSVQIKVLHEVESVSIYMVFKDSIKNVCEEKFLVEDIPDERVYSKYLGKLEWISVRTARLSTKNGEYFVETYE